MDSQSQSNKRTVRNLAIFTFLVITVGWFGLWLNALMGNPPPQESLGMLIWLITPLAASLLLRAFAGDGWKDMGIRSAIKGNVLWYAVSILIHPIGITLILLVGLASGAISFPNFSPDKVGLFVQGFALLIASQFIKNIFEEFAWRGYLAPKVYSLGLNVFVAHVVVGLIWGAWHLPFLSFVMSYLTESPMTLIPRLLLGTIAASIVFGEIRILTGSVWPAVLMHTVGGAFVGALLLENLIKMTSGTEFLVSPGIEGGLSIVLFTAIGVGIHLLRRKRTAIARA